MTAESMTETQNTQPVLTAPAYAVTKALSHAARPGPTEHGWGRAMCNPRLYVSIEYTRDDEPVLAKDAATGDAATPDCLHCRRALCAWKATQ